MIIGADPNPIRHENQEPPKSIILAAFISVITIAILIDKAPTKGCVRWNLKQDSLGANHAFVLEEGATLESYRNKKLDEYQGVTRQLLESEKSELDCRQANLGSREKRNCAPLTDAIAKLNGNLKKAEQSFNDADKKYREALSRVEKARMKINLHSENKPYFCKRSFKSHR